MTPLSNQQKQLLFDYSLGLTTSRQTADAQKLLSRNQEAVELYRTFQNILSPLESMEPDPCPEELTERLFARLKEAAQERREVNRLGELLAAERSGPRMIKIPLWRNWGEIVTAAAAVALFVSVLFPSVGFMRYKYAQSRCGTQLAGIYEGYRNYASDHNGLLPAVAMTPGSPYWKVGYQGQENYSNTRQVWLLVKNGYVQANQFLCPGRREPHQISFDGFKIQNFSDFPSRIYIQFSVPVAHPTSDNRDLAKKRILMADRNPLSEDLPADLSESCRLQLGERLMRANSSNHRNRGQNVLLHDGSVEFTRKRCASISEDDIYTIQGMRSGTEFCGCELPSSDTDIFLAP
jgi:hypothetical protein